MMIQVQWITDPVTGWIEYDHSEWMSLPKKPDPKGDESIDSAPGWINSLNIQGTTFLGDHIALEERDGKVVVYCWNDDPEDYEPEGYSGCVYLFTPLKPKAITTDIEPFHYRTGQFDKFPLPPEAITRHGKWTTGDLQVLRDAYPVAGWTYWVPVDA